MHHRSDRVWPLWCAVLALAPALGAQDWPHWRGPRHDGSTEVEGLPARFDRKENVLWSAPLPGPGAGTPIAVGERVFVSAVDRERDRLVALCLSLKDGKVLWQRDAGSGYRPGGVGSRIAGGARSNYASPSPATDGKRVVFFFGNGDLVAFDYEGKELWRRNLQQDYGDFAFQWTFSASPTLWQGKLFLPVLQRDVEVAHRRPQGRRGRRRGPNAGEGPREGIESFLLAMDPATGKTLYRHVRPSPARVESREAYTTPIPWTDADGKPQLLVVGGDVLTGHDPATGAELWRWGTWNPGHRERSWRLVPSVVVGDGIAAVCAPKRAPVYAVRLGGTGELGDAALAWSSGGRRNPVSSDVPTPAFHDHHFYVLSDVRNALSKVEAKTGKVVWTTELPRDHPWRASPTVADGRVWLMDHAGTVLAVDAGSGEIVQRAAMGSEDDDMIRSSVAVADRSLLIRTNSTLYRIGR